MGGRSSDGVNLTRLMTPEGVGELCFSTLSPSGNIVANYVKGKEVKQAIDKKLEINQRTKVPVQSAKHAMHMPKYNAISPY